MSMLFKTAATVLTCLLLPAFVCAQENRERVISKAFQPNEPLEVVDTHIGSRTVKFDSKFVGDDDWLKGLTFKLKNKSGKAIVFLQVYLYAPESPASEELVRVSIEYGRIPPPTGDGASSTAPEPLLEGKQLDLALDDSTYNTLLGLVSMKSGSAKINKVEARIGMVVFGDGTAWKNGVPLRRDPNKPNRWVNANPPANNPSVKGGIIKPSFFFTLFPFH